MSDLNQLDRVLTQVLEEAWEVFWKDVLVYLLASILCLLLIAVSLGLLSGVVAVGFALLVKARRCGEDAGVGTVMNGFGHALSATLALLVVVVAVLIGTALLVLPGLFLAAAWSFTFYAMAYEDLGPGAALSRSYEVFKEHALLVVVLMIGLGALNTIASALLFAQLLTVPYSMVVMAIAYEKLAQAPSPSPAVDQLTPHGLR